MAQDRKAYILQRIKILDNGCWQWCRFVTYDGYGVAYDKGQARAHRVSYKAFKGPIQAGFVIDHLCRNRACVNPEHLEAVSSRTNTLRGAMVDLRHLVDFPEGYRHGFTSGPWKMKPIVK